MSTENVKAFYTQLILSGFSHFIQSPDDDSTGTSIVEDTGAPTKEFWEQKAYKLLIPVVVKRIDLPDTKHAYEIRIAIDTDVPVATYGRTSKKVSGQVFNLPAEKKRDTSSIPMVYGIHEGGVGALSPTAIHNVQRDTTYIVSRFLGTITRAIECILLHSGGAATRDDDTGKRTESIPTRDNLGKHQKTGRGKKIRDEIRGEASSEETSGMVEPDGPMVGMRQGNGQD